MKKLLHLILFQTSFFKEYPSISLAENEIGERVFLEADGEQTDVSKKHWLLSLEPMIFGIWLDNDTDFKSKTCSLHFLSKQNMTMAITELALTETIAEKEGKLLLFTVQKSELLHVNPLKTKLIYWLHYKKPNMSWDQFRNLAAAFSYPRKVRLVSFKKGHYFNLFPMDLTGSIPNTNRFVFGLRHSNRTLDKIMAERKIVLAEVPSSLKGDIYQLAKHHSENPPNIEALPFRVIETGLLQFPIPEATLKYHEVKILKTLDLGSHMLLCGESMNSVIVNEKEKHLYHLHFLAHWQQGKQASR